MIMALQLQGHAVGFAFDDSAALKKTADFQPDLVL